MENQTELKWHQKPTSIIILLVLFFPVGLYYMWKNDIWTKKTRWIVTASLAILFLVNAFGENSGGELNGKKFMYIDNVTDIGGVIEFDSNKKCNFFLSAGTFKKSTLGTYILDKDEITFIWDKGIGPKSGKLTKESEKDNEWKIDIGTAVYTEFKD
jgi:hypothetical protein